LQKDLYNFAAHHRLGLLEMLRRDFPAARQHLEQASALAPEHRGVRKSLAYCYVWLGLFEDALPLVQDIPEAKSEMDAYRTYWSSLGRGDLAAQADEMYRLLP